MINFKRILLALPFAVMLSYMLVSFTTTIHSVQGESSAPVIMEGDRLFGIKQLDPKRGELSMWNCAKCGSSAIGKYTLAVPGDHLKIDGENIYVNGEKTDVKATGFDFYDGVMGADEYFLIGLNPEHSIDSRHLGTFSINDHISRLVYVQKNATSTVFAAEKESTDGW